MEILHAGPKVGLILLLGTLTLIISCASSGSGENYRIDEPFTAANLESNLAVARRAMGDDACDRAQEITGMAMEHIAAMRIHLEDSHPSRLWLDSIETEAFYVSAGAHFNAGEWDDAVAAYDAAIAISPWSSQSHFYRAQALHLLDRSDEALDGVLTALEIFPWEIEFYEFMYFLRNRLGLEPREDSKLLHQLNLLVHWQDFFDGPASRLIPFVPISGPAEVSGSPAYHQVLALPDGTLIAGEILQVGDEVAGIAVADRFELTDLRDNKIAFSLEPVEILKGPVRITNVAIEFFMVDGATMMGTFIYRIHYQPME